MLLRAGVVDEVVKKVRRAWDVDALNDIDDIRNAHNKQSARLLLDVLVDEMEVELLSEADVVSKTPSLALLDGADHHAERHCAYRVGHVHVMLTTQPTCRACQQWLVLLAQQLHCSLVVVSGALTARGEVFVVHPGITIAHDQDSGGRR